MDTDINGLIHELKKQAIAHHEYFHYTTVDKYLKMIKPVALPNGESHRMFWLTQATETNDKFERNYGNGEYLGCFTYSPYESVGMWFMYGKQHHDAARIGFDLRHFTKWLNSCIRNNGMTRTIMAFGIDENNGYEEIPSEEIDDVCIYDVAYVLSRQDIDHHGWPCNVEWRRNCHRVIDSDMDIVSGNGAFLYAEDFTDKVCHKLPFCFKKKGWANEREVRIVVSLKPEATRWKRIAIPFDEPLAFSESHTKEYVILGPWHKDGDLHGLVDEQSVGRSVFTGEL